MAGPCAFGGRPCLAGSRPHILLVGGDGQPSGVPRHICDLARALQGMARVTVLSEPDQGGYTLLQDLGAAHLALPGLASRMRPAALHRGLAGLHQALAADAYDLVWFHARLPVLMGRYLLARGHWRPQRARVALTYHGLPFGPGHRPGASALSRQIERALLRRCPPLALVCLNKTQARTLKSAMGGDVAPHGLHVLGNASSLGAIPDTAPEPGKRQLVMTGRAGWQKNLDRALRLMRHLPADIYLSLCGPGTDTPAFAKRAAHMAGPAFARVALLGPLPDVRPLLARADGYLLTSRYEGVPIGALEASEAGLPLILAPFAGAEDLLADHPLGLALQDAPEDAARAVDALLMQYQNARPSLRAAIQAHWAARYAPAAFDRAAQKLVQEWLTPI